MVAPRRPESTPGDLLTLLFTLKIIRDFIPKLGGIAKRLDVVTGMIIGGQVGSDIRDLERTAGGDLIRPRIDGPSRDIQAVPIVLPRQGGAVNIYDDFGAVVVRDRLLGGIQPGRMNRASRS